VELVATTVSGQLNAVEPEIVGIFDGGMKENDAELVEMPLSLAQRLMGTNGVSYVAVRLRDRSAASAFSRDLVAAARAKGFDLVAAPWTEHVIGMEQRRGMGVLNVFRSLMSVVIVLIAGMSVLTTMARAVSERTREIGTLRSIGFLRRHVVLLFALEAALLAAVAFAIGLAATLGLTAAANGSGITYNAGLFAQPIPLAVRYVPRTWAEAAALLAAIAALAALVPARRAARTRIPDALTHT
jgi:putative ABC transport system permease protein